MSYFRVDSEASFNELRPHCSICLIGIGGIAMSQLAILLKKLGYQVIGIDSQIYNPAKMILTQNGIEVFCDVSCINWNSIQLCVIGNSVTRLHPALKTIEEKQIPFCSMPKALTDLLGNKKNRIVVAGTHGKSTTAALTAYGLKSLGYDPSYFVGAITKDNQTLTHAGKDDIAVFEGDEYDSAFFAKFSKFYYYRPNLFVVMSIDYDHRDIFPDEESYIENFCNFINQLPGKSICLIHEQAYRKICSRLSFSSDQIALFPSEHFWIKPFGEDEAIVKLNDEQAKIKHSLIGRHNLDNILASLMACKLTTGKYSTDIRCFPGLKRRLEIIKKTHNFVLVDDFAHHPREVYAGLKALREKFKSHKICVFFEPRSNTSRSKLFEDEYAKSLSLADFVCIRKPVIRHNDDPLKMLDAETVLSKSGSNGLVLNEATPTLTQDILDQLLRIYNEWVIVVMTNGSFDGLVETLNQLIP
ncbi:MAG: Mur ligase family protein [Deltaproteobacteria bacterium]|nr:Mur ligase family protein [Deltaproteobacteria bacterium]